MVAYVPNTYSVHTSIVSVSRTVTRLHRRRRIKSWQDSITVPADKCDEYRVGDPRETSCIVIFYGKLCLSLEPEFGLAIHDVPLRLAA